MSATTGLLSRLFWALLAVLPPLMVVPWVLVGTLLRRMVGLKGHPDWSFRHEVVFKTTHLISHSVIGGDVRMLRHGLLNPPPSWRPLGLPVYRTALGGRPAEVTTPPGWTEGDPLMLYLHGGGYGVCGPPTHRGIVANIAEASGFRIVSLDYRLAPEHPFPAALDDAVAAWRQLGEGHDGPMYVGGDSAGGGLTLCLMLKLRDLGERLPTAAAVMSPWTDLTLSGPSHAEWAHTDYLPYPLVDAFAEAYTDDRRQPLVSPAFADFTGLPPTMVQYGELEVLRWDAEEAIRCMKTAGVPVKEDMWPAMTHVFQGFSPFVPEARQALRRLGFWLREQR